MGGLFSRKTDGDSTKARSCVQSSSVSKPLTHVAAAQDVFLNGNEISRTLEVAKAAWSLVDTVALSLSLWILDILGCL